MDLGELEQVESVRQIWKDEARDFTPWLAQPSNLANLSKHLNLGEEGLELEAIEHSVGRYSADIVCKNTNDNSLVLIENQLEATDHSHLGQIITYAAGLDVSIIVWIATKMTDEHVAAINWLNEKTAKELSFFGIVLELWKIGDSAVAPRFNIVAQPNNWLRQTSELKRKIQDQELSPTRQMQLTFWEAFGERLEASGSQVRRTKGQPQGWIAHGIGKANFSLNCAINTQSNWIRTEIYLGGNKSKENFNSLETAKNEIENELGFALDWQYLPERNDCRICISKNVKNVLDETEWPEYHDWLVSNVNKFYAVFHDRIRNIDNVSDTNLP